MRHDLDIDRILDRWFSDGPDQVSDRVMDVVTSRIGRQRQRSLWRLDRRPQPVNTYVRFAVAIAAVLVLAIGGLVLLKPSSSSVGGPGPTASASASPSPSSSPTPPPTPFACEDNLPKCGGPLIAGAHRASSFDPRVFFSTPSGWVNSIDQTTVYKLDPEDGGPSILIWSQASITEQKSSCDPAPRPGARSRAKDWHDFVLSHPGLVATNVAPVDLDGSKGWTMDISVKADWTATCPAHGAKPYVMLLANALGGEYGVASGEPLHLVVVDVGAPTKTVVIQVYGQPAAIPNAKVLIDSFSFRCGPSSGRGPCGAGS